MKFSIGKIVLDRINIAYKDATTGNNVKTFWAILIPISRNLIWIK